MAKHLKIYKMDWQKVLRNVGGLIKQGGPLYPEPVWYQPALSVAPRMERPAGSRPERPPLIVLPEDEHVKAFYRIFPEEQEDQAAGDGTTLPHVPPARIFAHRVLELLKNDCDMPTAYEVAVAEHEVRQEFRDPAAIREMLERMKWRGDGSEATDALDEDGEDASDDSDSEYEEEEPENDYKSGYRAESDDFEDHEGDRLQESGPSRSVAASRH